MLEIKDLYVNYGMIEALHGISFKINEGEIVALIGANGAGKTTTLHAISGLIKAQSGEILLNDKDIVKVSGNKIVINVVSVFDPTKSDTVYITVA